MTPADLVIQGGLVHTGSTDNEVVRADVAVSAGRIAGIAPRIPASGARALDAAGCIVCPGFVDIHAHSDQAALDFPDAQSKVCDGVTTEISGNCGGSLFPSRSAAGDAASPARTVAGFFQEVERAGTALNRGFLVGHGSVRKAVMGYEALQPSADEVGAMRSLVAQALDEGALGLSSGLAYAPGSFARAAELAALCREVASRGGFYATHIRNEGDALIESVQEALDTATAGGVRLQIGHLKTLGRANWRKIDALDQLLSKAREDGVDVCADRYPYLACSTSLAALFGPWLMEGGVGRGVERLRDPACRRRLAGEQGTEFGGDMLWESVVVASVKTDAGRHWVGHPIAGMARQLGKDPLDAALDLLAQEVMRVSVVVFAMSEANLGRILTWPFVMVATDASARDFVTEKGRSLPHPRAFGTFSRVLGRLVRQDRILDLGRAIAKMTSMPAERIGLRQRGRIEQGFFADITVFDPAAVLDQATYEDPFQPSEGIRHVLVNGVPVLEQGRPTGARPGRVLRRGTDTA